MDYSRVRHVFAAISEGEAGPCSIASRAASPGIPNTPLRARAGDRRGVHDNRKRPPHDNRPRPHIGIAIEGAVKGVCLADTPTAPAAHGTGRSNPDTVGVLNMAPIARGADPNPP